MRAIGHAAAPATPRRRHAPPLRSAPPPPPRRIVTHGSRDLLRYDEAEGLVPPSVLGHIVRYGLYAREDLRSDGIGDEEVHSSGLNSERDSPRYD